MMARMRERRGPLPNGWAQAIALQVRMTWPDAPDWQPPPSSWAALPTFQAEPIASPAAPEWLPAAAVPPRPGSAATPSVAVVARPVRSRVRRVIGARATDVSSPERSSYTSGRRPVEGGVTRGCPVARRLVWLDIADPP